jgi:WXG100 family type VII secretion target
VKIRIDTDHAREVGRRLRAEGDRISEIGRELGGAIGSLDTGAWDGRSRHRVEPMVDRVRPQAEAVAQELETLGSKLVRAADTFELRDNTAAGNVGDLPWVNFGDEIVVDAIWGSVAKGLGVGVVAGLIGGTGVGIAAGTGILVWDWLSSKNGKPSEIPDETKVSSFGKSGVMSDQDVRKFLNKDFPAAHTDPAHLTGIEYTDTYVPASKPGYYQAGLCTTNTTKNTSFIVINRQSPTGSSDKGSMKGTIAHEVGHNVYYNVVPEKARNDWDALSNGSTATQYVSDYAKTNVREDFAETYRTYMLDPDALKAASKDKYEFMRDRVFDGREYGKKKAVWYKPWTWW